MNTFKSLIGVALFAAAGAATGTPPAAQLPQTARSGMEAAVSIARQWRADAVLTGIGTFDANPAGLSRQWTYHFHSRKARKGLSLQWQGAKPVSQEMPVDATSALGAFIDSDVAMTVAKEHGLRSKGAVPMTLRALGGGASEAIYWTVGTAFARGETAVVLAAKDGALITTHEGS